MNIFLDVIHFLHNLIQQLLHIEDICHCIPKIYNSFFLFYLVCRINILTVTLKMYFMTFAIHQLNWLKNKIISSHWFFYTSSISWTKWLKEFINNLICIIIRCKFYIVAPWVHYTLFFSVFWRNIVNCYC